MEFNEKLQELKKGLHRKNFQKYYMFPVLRFQNGNQVEGTQISIL